MHLESKEVGLQLVSIKSQKKNEKKTKKKPQLKRGKQTKADVINLLRIVYKNIIFIEMQ